MSCVFQIVRLQISRALELGLFTNTQPKLQASLQRSAYFFLKYYDHETSQHAPVLITGGARDHYKM